MNEATEHASKVEAFVTELRALLQKYDLKLDNTCCGCSTFDVFPKGYDPYAEHLMDENEIPIEEVSKVNITFIRREEP